MELLKNNVYKISYVKANGVHMERAIIPIKEVPKNVLTLDVTDLSETEMESLVTKQKEYSEYVAMHLATMFDFATWFEHTTSTPVPESWTKVRAFSVNNIKEAQIRL